MDRRRRFVEAASDGAGEVKAHAAIGQRDGRGVEGEAHPVGKAGDLDDLRGGPLAAFVGREMDGDFVEVRTEIGGEMLARGD